MMRLSALSLLLFLAPSSCSSTRVAAAPDTQDASPSTPDEGDIAEKERELGLARLKLRVAQLEFEGGVQEFKLDKEHAEIEMQTAKARFEQFNEHDAPSRLAEARLDLRAARDRAREAADELAQIEIMYKDQDLNDVTAEFVVSRGKRNAERAAARIAIQENELAALESSALPLEAAGLELEQRKASAGVLKLERAMEVDRARKELALEEARGAIEELERELAKMRDGDKQ